MSQHVLSQPASSPCQSVASSLEQRVSGLTVGKLFAKAVNSMLFSARLVMLPQHASLYYSAFKYGINGLPAIGGINIGGLEVVWPYLLEAVV